MDDGAGDQQHGRLEVIARGPGPEAAISGPRMRHMAASSHCINWSGPAGAGCLGRCAIRYLCAVTTLAAPKRKSLARNNKTWMGCSGSNNLAGDFDCLVQAQHDLEAGMSDGSTLGIVGIDVHHTATALA